ncbi:MAG: class I SAM-dependent methyltransferase [Candidatus Kapabacteria bacterium]|nr:class I SAM-dependent methyltransferase [Candidatus Kapabacteria bacterium]
MTHHDPVDTISLMDLHPRTIRNVRMQYRLAQHTLIPWMESLAVLPPNAAVCEIGCAEGGVLAAFVDRGATKALGTDIQEPLLRIISQPVWTGLGYDITFTQHDVIYDEIPDEWKSRFDVVLLRDVIEHLDDAGVALKNIARLLKPGGVVVVTFPPYTSPFGGHQQLLSTKLGSLPFVHLLPWPLFRGIIRGGDPDNQEELERLHRIRCSASKVSSAAQRAGLDIISQRYFALRPVFRWKYQRAIPSFEVTSLRWLPLVKDLAMEVAFILRTPQ